MFEYQTKVSTCSKRTRLSATLPDPTVNMSPAEMRILLSVSSMESAAVRNSIISLPYLDLISAHLLRNALLQSQKALPAAVGIARQVSQQTLLGSNLS